MRPRNAGSRRPLVTTTVIALALTVVAPRPGQTAPVARRLTLANGLEVIVVESRLTPLVSLAIAIRHGVMAEGPTESGTAHLLEHMLYRAHDTPPTDRPVIARERDLGVARLGGTYEEVMYVGVTSPAANLDGAMEYLRDLALSPRFDEARLATEKRLIALEEGHRSGDDTGQRAGRIDRLLWWKYPSRKTNLLELESLPALTVADLQRTRARYLVPENAALVVVGNADAERVMGRAGQVFGGWQPAGTTPEASREAPRHPPLTRSHVVVEPVESPLVAGAFFWHGPSTPGPDSKLAQAARLLGPALRLATSGSGEIKDQCSSFDVAFTPSSNVGTLRASWLAEPDRADGCIVAIVEQLPAAARALTDADLKAARQIAEGEIVRGRELPEVLLREVARAWSAGDLAESLDIVTKLAAVERSDVARLVDRFFAGRPFVLSVHLPQKQIAGGLNLRHFETLIRKRQPPQR